jgi:hypothetical protein
MGRSNPTASTFIVTRAKLLLRRGVTGTWMVGSAFLPACQSNSDSRPEAAPSDTATVAASTGANPVWPDSGTERAIVPFPTDSAARSNIPLCDSTSPTITERSVGPVALPGTVQSLIDRCKRAVFGWTSINDTDSLRPAGLIRAGGAVLQLVFSDTSRTGRIDRVILTDTSARIADGLRIGGSLASFTKTFGPAVVYEQECRFTASFPKAPWILAELQYPSEVECPVERVSRRHVEEHVPGESTIIRITVLARRDT